jgi:hypothetical protein
VARPALPPPGGGGAIDPKRNVEQLHLASKKESESRTFPDPEAARAHAAQQASTWALHQSAHEQALEEIKKHKKKWERARVSTHVKTAPRQGFALTGAKSHHYTISVDGTVVDEPQESFTPMGVNPPVETYGRDQSYAEYLRDLTTAWQVNKPQATRDQHTPFGDAETERAKYLDEIQNAWKQKPKPAQIRQVGGFAAMSQPKVENFSTLDQPTGDASAQAYAEYCADISNAWKAGKGHQ